jgi:hypothetical protein
VVVGNSAIYENSTGLASSGGATLVTYQNNTGKGLNPTDGLFTGTIQPY